MLVFTAASTASTASGYGLFLLETLAALALIGAAAWGLVRLLGRRDLFGKRGTRLRLVERLPLDARRSIHLVQVDDETLLIGTAEQGVTLLKTLSTKAPEGSVDVSESSASDGAAS